MHTLKLHLKVCFCGFYLAQCAKPPVWQLLGVEALRHVLHILAHGQLTFEAKLKFLSTWAGDFDESQHN